MSSPADTKINSMSPQFVVTDIDSSIEFYTASLGFDIDFRYEDFYAGVTKEGFTMHLKSGSPSAEERQRKRVNEDLDFVFSVFNIEALHRQLSGKLVEIIQPLREMPYGKEFYISDPDGYIISFLETA